MKKKMIGGLVLIAVICAVVFGVRVVMQSRHLYFVERVCYAPMKAPECSDLQEFTFVHIQGSKGLKPGRIMFVWGTLSTVGTIPLEWNFEIHEHNGDHGLLLDVLRFRPWTWNRTSDQFGTFTSKTIEVNDSLAVMKVVGGIDSLRSIIQLRRRW